ncbi:MAG: M16 family metallopeptidase [Alphaproteobacteria bacterium]
MTRFLVILFCLVVSVPAFAAKGKVLDVQVIKAPPGAEAWLVEDHTVPVISMSFSFEGGIAYDPDDKPGVGRLISTLLDEGAGDMKSQEYQGKLEENAISMSYTAGRDAFYGSVATLSANRAIAFDLLALALSKPRFDQDAIDRMKNANVAQIKKDLGDPSWLVARTFNGMLFEGHYYARPGFGNLDSMNAITRKDLLDFVAAQFGRNVLKVSIAGDISKDDAEKAVEKIFGPLPEKAEPNDLPEVQPGYGGKIIMLPLDTPQTFISVGEAGIKRTDKDWHAAMVMNCILGGSSFDARLMKEIRAKRGLTYGVYSSLSSMKHAGILQANMSASNDKVEEALRLLKESWAEMSKDGPTTDEFQNAKSYLTGALPLELTSTGDIAGALNGIQRDGLGADYINKRNDIINALSLGDIKRVAARLLKADQLAIVLVGKPRNINVDILLDKPPGMGGDGKTP